MGKLESLLGEPEFVGLIGAEEPVPEFENAVVTTVVSVVPVVATFAEHERGEEAPGRERGEIARVSGDSFPHAEDHPEGKGEEVRTHDEAASDGGEGGKGEIEGMVEFSSQRNGGDEAVVLGVEMFVKPGGGVEEEMDPVEEEIVDEGDGDEIPKNAPS